MTFSVICKRVLFLGSATALVRCGGAIMRLFLLVCVGGFSATSFAAQGSEQLEVVERGNRPRDKLVVRPDAGAAGRCTLELEKVIHVGRAAKPRTTRMTMETNYSIVSSERKHGYAVEMGFSHPESAIDADSPLEPTQGSDEEIRTIVASGVRLARGSDGVLTESSSLLDGDAVESPSGLVAGMRHHLETTTSYRIPKRAVGLGAVWVVTSKGEDYGRATLRESTFTLTSRKGPELVLDVVESISVLPSTPQGEPGADEALKTLEISGQVHVEMNLERAMPWLVTNNSQRTDVVLGSIYGMTMNTLVESRTQRIMRCDEDSAR